MARFRSRTAIILFLVLLAIGIYAVNWETVISVGAYSKLHVEGEMFFEVMRGNHALKFTVPERLGPASLEKASLNVRVVCEEKVQGGFYGYGASFTFSNPQVDVKIFLNNNVIKSSIVNGKGTIKVQINSPGDLEVYLVGVGESANCTVSGSLEAVYSLKASLRR